MKVGTDGVLLGAWASIARASDILDIGTGTGLIALMAAQRNKSAEICAIEINENAYKQANENIKNSPWSKRIKLFHEDILHFKPKQKFDSIICNPPFFIHSTPTPNQDRNTARHCHEFSHSDLLDISSRLLTSNGNLSVILPLEEGEELIRLSSTYHLFPNRVTEVYPTLKSVQPKRLLIEFTTQTDGTFRDKLVIEHSRHVYSPEYRELTGEFYL